MNFVLPTFSQVFCTEHIFILKIREKYIIYSSSGLIIVGPGCVGHAQAGSGNTLSLRTPFWLTGMSLDPGVKTWTPGLSQQSLPGQSQQLVPKVGPDYWFHNLDHELWWSVVKVLPNLREIKASTTMQQSFSCTIHFKIFFFLKI